MELVACINTLRCQKEPDTKIVEALQVRLENLDQNMVIKPEHNHPLQSSKHSGNSIDETRIKTTAQLYSLAALIYFRRQIQHATPQSDMIQTPVHLALTLIAEMEACTSPWPLFVVACEVQNDDQRAQVLTTLYQMEEQRRIGNIGVTRMIIEAVWKQNDLVAHDATKIVPRTTMDWRSIIDMEEMTPSFI